MSDQLVKGAVIEDPAFMSTSLSRDVAKSFGNTVMTIRVPAGTKALKMFDVFHTTSTQAEKEILLQHDTKLEITHVRKETGGFLGMGAKTYIDARVV
jgi:hypothetical protein